MSRLRISPQLRFPNQHRNQNARHPCPLGSMILGVERHNPLLPIYHDEEQPQFLVYYGFEVITIVPADTEGPAIDHE